MGLAVYNRLIRAAAFCVIDLEKPFLIGLTGQTGAGKSYVAEKLKKMGYNIVDADHYARKLTEDNSPILPLIAQKFGEDTVQNSVLNRKLLASRVFGNKDLLSELNSIMHPRILEMCESAAEFPCVLDAPQLFESGGERLCARVLSVTAPEELRLKRIMKRDGITPEQAAQRMNAQYSEEFFKENSDFTVINDGRDIISQLKLFKEELL